MNHDGNLSIVLSQASQKYRKACCSLFGPIYEQTIFSNVWLGRGDGTFGRVSTTTRVVTLSAPLNHDYILTGTFADVNRDDKPDEIWLGAPGILNVRLSNGDGTYQLPRTFDAGPAPETLAVGDFDGDGWVDVIVVNAQPSSAPTLSVLINDRTSEWQAVGGDLAARRSPRRPGTARAPGLRVRTDVPFILPQTAVI